MISDSWTWNLIGGFLLALTATFAMAEARSSSLVPKSLLLWPSLVVLLGILTFIQGWSFYGFSVSVILGIFLILAGAQAFLVNIRKLARWPSGSIWLGLLLGAVLVNAIC